MTSTTVQRALCAAGIACLLIAPASAQDATLPGGANSLREVHGDWIVSCTMSGRGGEARKACAMSQEQHEERSGRRIVAMEIQPAEGAAAAGFVLPFGLDLAAGAALQIDNGVQGEPLPFRTCLPVGCVISSDLDAEMLASLRRAAALKVHAKADGGGETTLTISLRGFGSAFDRTVELMN